MVCLETSFLVDVIRGNKDAEKVLENLISENEAITIASPSIMEIISGASLDKSAKKEKEKILEIVLSFNILDFGVTEAMLAGEIQAELILGGNTIEEIDIMIGAITKHNEETLLTRNKKHFERINGLKIESY